MACFNIGGREPGGYAAPPPDYQPEVGKPKELDLLAHV